MQLKERKKMNLRQKVELLNNSFTPFDFEKPEPVTFNDCKTKFENELLRRARQGCTTFSAAISPYSVNPGVFCLGSTGDINKDRIIAVDLKEWLKTENMNPILNPSISDNPDDPFYAFYLDLGWKEDKKQELDDLFYRNVKKIVKEKIREVIQKHLKIGVSKLADNLVISIKHHNELIGQLNILEQDILMYKTSFSDHVYCFCEDVIRRHAEYATETLFQTIIKELVATAIRVMTRKKLGVTDEDIKGWWNDLDTECDREWIDKIKKGTS